MQIEVIKGFDTEQVQSKANAWLEQNDVEVVTVVLTPNNIVQFYENEPTRICSQFTEYIMTLIYKKP